MISLAFEHGTCVALSAYGVKQADIGGMPSFHPGAHPMNPARPGIMSAPTMRPAQPTATAIPVHDRLPQGVPALSPPGPASAQPAEGVLRNIASSGASMGRGLSRFMRPMGRTIGLMGLGALGASMLGHHSSDDQLSYAPMQGSFMQ
jgi:hypothetical protein